MWKDSRISGYLVGAVGIEPTTFGLKGHFGHSNPETPKELTSRIPRHLAVTCAGSREAARGT